MYKKYYDDRMITFNQYMDIKLIGLTCRYQLRYLCCWIARERINQQFIIHRSIAPIGTDGKFDGTNKKRTNPYNFLLIIPIHTSFSPLFRISFLVIIALLDVELARFNFSIPCHGYS